MIQPVQIDALHTHIDITDINDTDIDSAVLARINIFQDPEIPAEGVMQIRYPADRGVIILICSIDI